MALNLRASINECMGSWMALNVLQFSQFDQENQGRVEQNQGFSSQTFLSVSFHR
jgi:hypothetical protein